MPVNKQFERVCAYVDMDAVLFNINSILQCIPQDTQIMAVLKTDAYGHGSVAIARELEQEPRVWGYAAATVEEAVQLRKSGVKKPILVLGYVFPSGYDRLIEYDIRTTVFTTEMAREMSDRAIKSGKKLTVHIKVDTGMGRIGLATDESGLQVLSDITDCPGLNVEGIFTHFARADEADKTNAYAQYERFTAFCEQAEKRTGRHFLLKHCANSAAILEMPGVHMQLVRAGIVLYGLTPAEGDGESPVSIRPAMSLKSHVVYVKTLKKGDSVSYGGTFTASGPMLVATVPAGYGDGYPRDLSGKGEVLIAGRRCPILGRVCMDQLMVDVSAIPDTKTGDEVTLIGRDGQEEITIGELGRLSGRFHYELACDIGKRIPRVFLKDGVPIALKDYDEDVPTVFL